MSRLQRYVEQYGPVAGPKLYHALQSRSAYIGANARRRQSIAALTGIPVRPRRPSRSVIASAPLLDEPTVGVPLAGEVGPGEA